MNTVRRHLALESAPKYERKVKRRMKLEQFEEYLRDRAADKKVHAQATQTNWAEDSGAPASCR